MGNSGGITSKVRRHCHAFRGEKKCNNKNRKFVGISFPLHIDRTDSNKLINPFFVCFIIFSLFSAAMWKRHCNCLLRGNTIPPLIHSGAHEDKQHLTAQMHSTLTDALSISMEKG